MPFSSLLEQLREGDPAERCAAAARLAREGMDAADGRPSPLVLRALLRQLADSDPLVQSACLTALHQLGEGRLAEDLRWALEGDWADLRTLLRHRDPARRQALLAACGTLALEGPSVRGRQQALRYLAWARDRASLWVVLHVLFDSPPDSPLRGEAIQALGRDAALMRALSLPPLLWFLAQGSWEHDWHRDRLLQLLREAGRNRTLAAVWHTHNAPFIVKHHLNWYYRQSWWDRVWGRAGSAPGWHQEPPSWWEWLLFPLMRMVTLLPNDQPPRPPQDSPASRRLAAWWDQVVVRLGRFPAEWRRFFGWSRHLAPAKSAEVRAAALAVFLFAGRSSAETALFAALSDPDERVRELARQGLRQQGLEELERAVSGGLARDHGVIPLLRELSDERVKWSLLFALLQGDPERRAHAAWALGEWGDASAIPTLRWLSRPWRGVGREVKEAAREAIQQIERLNLERAIVLVDEPADRLGAPERSLTLAEGEAAERQERALSPIEEPQKARLLEGVETETEAVPVRRQQGEGTGQEDDEA